jgi:hypothetical protein
VPESYRSPDWALVPAKTGPKGGILMMIMMMMMMKHVAYLPILIIKK